MARPKQIDDRTIENLIKCFFATYNGKINKVTYAAITKYIKENGYPKYDIHTLIRNKTLKSFIDTIKNSQDEQTEAQLFVYRPINFDDFFATYNTKRAQIEALMQRDSYYQSITVAATRVIEQRNEAYKTIEKLKEELAAKEKETEEILSLVKSKSVLNNNQQRQLKACTKYLKNTVYPEYCDALLKTYSIQDEKPVHIDIANAKANIINAETEITSNSDLFKDFLSNFEIIESDEEGNGN